MTLTKSDIDGLIAAMATTGAPLYYEYPSNRFTLESITKALYLAAGLTAEGERKPERVRCWLVQYPFGERSVELVDPYLNPGGFHGVTPGTFVPDSTEPR